MDKDLLEKLTAILTEAETGDQPAVRVKGLDENMNAPTCRFSCNDKSVPFPCHASAAVVAELWGRSDAKPGSTRELLLSANLGNSGSR